MRDEGANFVYPRVAEFADFGVLCTKWVRITHLVIYPVPFDHIQK